MNTCFSAAEKIASIEPFTVMPIYFISAFTHTCNIDGDFAYVIFAETFVSFGLVPLLASNQLSPFIFICCTVPSEIAAMISILPFQRYPLSPLVPRVVLSIKEVVPRCGIKSSLSSL